ncbi:MAG: hypothetical protein H6656_18735 [Ardenticatenaceae bacterium]|nr:hypothetical protein [Ardenticatenaceae bacterium]
MYARLERPFIKLLEEEEDLAVHLLVDASASMNWPDDGDRLSVNGNQSENKLLYALRLAGRWGNWAGGWDLTAVTSSAARATTPGAFRGQQNSLRLLQFWKPAAAAASPI